MLNSVVITNHRGLSSELVLKDPYTNGINILNITGLGPPPAMINMSDYAVIDGALYNSTKIQARNIVFTIRFLPNVHGELHARSVEDIRHYVYELFPIGSPITMDFQTTGHNLRSYGYVENAELDMFSKDEELVISIQCPDPNFHQLFDGHIGLQKEMATISGGFEFPFANESTTERFLKFADIDVTTSINFVYDGQISTGFTIEVNVTGPVTNFVFYNQKTFESVRINSSTLVAMTGSDLIAGDRVVISTVAGRRQAVLYRSGDTYNILQTLGTNVTWPVVRQGSNSFTHSADAGVEFAFVNFEIDPIFRGI